MLAIINYWQKNLKEYKNTRSTVPSCPHYEIRGIRSTTFDGLPRQKQILDIPIRIQRHSCPVRHQNYAKWVSAPFKLQLPRWHYIKGN